MPKTRKISDESRAREQDVSQASAPLRFPLFLDLTEKRVAVIGGGRISARRVLVLLDFVQRITVIAPDLRPELEALALEDRIVVHKRAFQPDDLNDADLVITATGIAEIDDWVWRLCREKKLPINVAADQTKCDFFFPGIARKGSLIAGVTAGGTDHQLAKRAADAIRDLFSRLPE